MYTARVSEEDRRKAMEIATLRNSTPARSRKFDDSYSEIDIHYMAAVAELAWEKSTGWEMSKELLEAGDAGVDFTHNGRTYQLKTRNIQDETLKPDLLCRLDYAKADRFILSELDFSELYWVRFVGWCTREEITQEIMEAGDFPRYIRRRELLRKIPERVFVLDGRKL